MRLLLGEDEEELATALAAILKHNNYTVDVVYNGEDALNYLLSNVYDICVLDIMMPKMDGLTALKKARGEGITTPTIFLTAKSEIDDRVAGLDAGGDDYLTKPFASKELLARIRALTRRNSSALEENNLTFSDITLDLVNYTLKGPKGEESLANKEYQILEIMLKKKTPVSVETLMDKVWNFDDEVDNSVVWVYITYIRRKLEKVTDKVIIKSYRNLGYKVEEKNA